MVFTVKDLVLFYMHKRNSIGMIEVVTDKLIHLRRLEDDEWFFFNDDTYHEVKRNFGQLTLEELEIKYPEVLI